MSVLVEAAALGKSYPLVHRSRDRLRALARLLFARGNPEQIDVLQNVDLVVKRGESLGIIGENGAGKSTLLKLITGVLTPTTGRVAVNGRIGALLELGAGFHPDYSGRDNIELAATLYGMSPAELQTRLAEIVEFADIGPYIDEPVKHYSSGMVVRLGFAVIAALKPDLLITDEVLAVGDESFQKKCVRWMERFLADGGTLLLVSHSMYHVQKLCTHACWLQAGKVEMHGDVFDVTQAYLGYHERKSALAPDRAVMESQGLEFLLADVTLNDIGGESTLVTEYGESLRVRAHVRSRDGREPVALIGFARADGTPVYGVTNEMDAVPLARVDANRYALDVEFADLALLPGSYTVKVHALDSEGLRLFDTIERGLTIRGATREFGIVRLAHRWRDGAPP